MKTINIDYYCLNLLSDLGRDKMISFLDRYTIIVAQDPESEMMLKDIFPLKKTKRQRKS